MTILYLIRHGETIWNRDKRFQGHTDVALSEQGLWQASKLRQKLEKVDFSAIYTSDLSRAMATALESTSEKKLSVQTTSSLREIHFGEWEGKRFEEIMEQDPCRGRQWFRDPGRTAIPGGETDDAISRRIREFLSEMIEKHGGETVALFTHGGLIRYILMEALGLPRNLFWRLEIDNTSVTVLNHGEHGFTLNRLNDHSHLESIPEASDPLCQTPEPPKKHKAAQ